MSIRGQAAGLYSLDPSQRVTVELHDEDDAETRARKLFEAVAGDIFYVRLQQLAWSSFSKNKSYLTEFASAPSSSSSAAVTQLLEETGLRDVITNIAIRLYERSAALCSKTAGATSRYARTSRDESIDCIRETRIAWEQGINEELLAIVSESRRPFAVMRPAGVQNPLLESNALQSVPRESVRFLFDSEDLLETCVSIRNPNMRASHVERRLGLVKIALKVPSLYDLIKRYNELSPQFTQLGLDEAFLAGAHTGSKLCLDRHEQAEAISSFGNAIDARIFARRGCPPSLRGRVWRVALGLPDDPEADPWEGATFARLRGLCDSMDLLTDELFLHDVQNVTDDPKFFVFEDELKESVLCFARDDWVRFNSAYEVHRPLLGLAAASGGAVSGGGDAQPVLSPSSSSPPSAVQPFLGFAIYFAPLCYVYRDRVALYSVARQLWVRLWCKLNVLSGDEGTLMHVCGTFESLLFSLHPRLFLHCLKIGVQPLQVALPWMQLGFAGFLEVDQVLHLWDRVLGYQDPTLLAVMAVAVFMLRAEAILCSNVANDVGVMLLEGSRLRVVPMLQLVLFSHSSP
jgi:hypothetical protein